MSDPATPPAASATPPSAPPSDPTPTPPAPASATPPAQPTNTATPPANPTETPPAQPSNQPTPPAESKPAQAASLLADGSHDGENQPPAPDDPTNLSAEDYFAKVGFVKPIEFEGGGSLDERDARMLAGYLQADGIAPGSAMKVMATVAAYKNALDQRAAQEAADAANRMAEDAKAAFGPSLGRMIADARRGARAVFGADLATELLNIPEFGNNKAIIEALARHGRTSENDPGAGVGAESAATRAKDFLASWTGGVVKS